MLRSYLRYRQFLFLWTGIVLAIYAFLQYLYWYPLESIGYTALIVMTLLVLISALDYRRYRRRLRQLDSLTEAWISLEREMPDTRDPLEQRYQQLILKQRAILTEEKEKQNAAQKQREELVTMWMHQIKLPLASLSLILESLEPEDTISASHLNEMKLALVRTEQYAQTALKAIQIENLKEDLILEPCDLGELCAEVIRKQALPFILKKLQLNFTPFHQTIVTDRKWLGFILEQLLSNALKYTDAGTISVTFLCDPTPHLIIADTGRGIAAADQARLFERGYTGYNGHHDFKASGIGLYLCRKTADSLNIKLHLESEKEKGTQVHLIFPSPDLFFYR